MAERTIQLFACGLCGRESRDNRSVRPFIVEVLVPHVSLSEDRTSHLFTGEHEEAKMGGEICVMCAETLAYRIHDAVRGVNEDAAKAAEIIRKRSASETPTRSGRPGYGWGDDNA